MSSCVSSPTLTRTDQVVTDSFSTSTTSHVTTLPPSSTTLTLTPSCTASSGSCSASPTVTVSEIPGGTSTVLETVTFTVPVTSSQVTTLWGSSCTQTGRDTPTDTPTSSPTNTLPTLSTPPPSVIVTSSSSTLADGYVTPVVMTITSTLSPILVTPTISSSTGPDRNSNNLGPIIGGVVGGVVGLGAILFLVWFFIRRRRRWDDIFDNDDDVPAVAAVVTAVAVQKEKQQADTNPKPYHYGLVGHTKSSSLTTPPSSPPPNTASSLLDSGFDRAHQRNNSAAPLLGLPLNTTAHSTGVSVSLRPPSSTSSAPGYGPHADPIVQGQSWDPNRLYNPAMQPFQTQPFGSSAGAVSAVPAMIGVRSDTDPRAGTPVSFQEQRILQVTNADLNPQSPQSPQSPGARPASASGRTSFDPQRDGKGRIVTKGEKAPKVHLDGGRYQEGVAGSSSAAAPPAYFE